MPKPRDSRDIENRVTTEIAAAQGRCVCEGCRTCRGTVGYPCGQGGIAPALLCWWCRDYPRR
jgi:hypothetical protein